VQHRKNLSPRKAYVPSSWLLVLTVLVCVGGAGWLGWLLLDDGSSSTPEATPTPTATASSTPSAAPTPTATATPTRTKATASPTPDPTRTTKAPEVARDVPVSVLNNTGVRGAAATFSAKVTRAGWPLGGVGNWTGAIMGNTVYYPPAYEAKARLLARDVGIDRVLPRLANMRSDRLTIILAGPQS
jgi:hypothetical protein